MPTEANTNFKPERNFGSQINSDFKASTLLNSLSLFVIVIMSRTKNQARSAAADKVRSAAAAGRRHRRRRLLSVNEMRDWATSKRLEVNPKRLTFGHLRKPDIIAKLTHLDSKPPNADKLNVKALVKVLRQVVKNKYQNFKNNRTRDSDESSIFPESGDESMATLEGEESDDEVTTKASMKVSRWWI